MNNKNKSYSSSLSQKTHHITKPYPSKSKSCKKPTNIILDSTLIFQSDNLAVNGNSVFAKSPVIAPCVSNNFYAHSIPPEYNFIPILPSAPKPTKYKLRNMQHLPPLSKSRPDPTINLVLAEKEVRLFEKEALSHKKAQYGSLSDDDSKASELFLFPSTMMF